MYYIIILLYLSSQKISPRIIKNKFYLFLITLISVSFLSFENGILNETYKVYTITNSVDKTFDAALDDLMIPRESYVSPEQIQAIKGKNILVISMESLEQGFLNTRYSKFTPNLNALSKEYTYFRFV